MLLVRIVLMLSLLLVPTVALAGCGGDGDDGSSKAGTAADEADEVTAEDPASAGAEDPPAILPGQNVAGVSIAARADEVMALLGEPDRRQEFDSELSGATDERLEWDDPKVEVTMAPIQPFEDRETAKTEVVQVSTTDDSLHTVEGIGVGSSLADVEQAYPEVECDSGDIAICRLAATDNVVTDFFVEDDAVTRIVVGRIID